MALFYRIVERKNPQKKDESPKYYMEALKKGTIGLEELATLATKNTTLNPYELILELNLLIAKAYELNMQGFTADFGKAGYSRLTIKSKGASTPEEVTANNVKHISPQFFFKKSFIKTLQKIRLEKR